MCIHNSIVNSNERKRECSFSHTCRTEVELITHKECIYFTTVKKNTCILILVDLLIVTNFDSLRRFIYNYHYTAMRLYSDW